ncbi:hypothetical protein SMA67_26255, partial [Escherichia coli]|uniref:hypothetical protein n=1 Tax=Escherichia coli TaxID=562 RepID=UPI003079BACC
MRAPVLQAKTFGVSTNGRGCSSVSTLAYTGRSPQLAESMVYAVQEVVGHERDGSFAGHEHIHLPGDDEQT